MATILDATYVAAASLLASEEGFNPIRLTDATNALWTIVIFLVSLPLMWALVWGPMSKALEHRDQQAENAVKAAEAAKAAAEQARVDIEKRLAKAQDDSAKLITEARAIGEAQGREALAAAQAEAQKTLER